MPSVDAATAPDLQRAHALARRLLGCDHLAADAVQEAWVALWQQVETPAEPARWLRRAVVHRCRHLRRSLRRRQRHEHHAATVHCTLHAGCDNPLHVAYAHELGARLDRARSALPAAQRAVFERSEQPGFDYAAIAAELGLPLGTVRSRLHRARSAIAQALQERPPRSGR